MRLFSSIQARLLSALIPLPASITAGGNTVIGVGGFNGFVSAFEHFYEQNVLTISSDFKAFECFVLFFKIKFSIFIKFLLSTSSS